MATRPPSQVSQHALRASGTCHPTLETFSQGLRSLATLSLANATGCDGWTLRVLPLSTDASGHLTPSASLQPHLIPVPNVLGLSAPLTPTWPGSRANLSVKIRTSSMIGPSRAVIAWMFFVAA